MITKLIINNFMGIDNEFTINLLANNKIKRNNNSTKSIDETNILNELCIIGSNGSGKTSILKAVSTIQTFINFPFRKSKMDANKLIEQLQSLPKDLLDNMLKKNNTLTLPEPNLNNEKDTYIELELYIPYDNNDYCISGVYNYRLVYNKQYSEIGVIEESLKYRKKIESTKIIEIFNSHNLIESEIGTTLLYENNPSFVINDKINYYKTFGRTIIDRFDILFQRINIEKITEIFLLKSFKENDFIFNQICHIADNKISRIYLKKNDDKEELVFINNKNKELNFYQLSTGTIKVLNICSKILDSINNNKIILIDEIENSLHPSLTKFLIRLLMECGKDSYSQLLFTTHSTYLFDLLENDQIYYINTINNNHFIESISNAIKDGIIHKDKSIKIALEQELLISNPNKDDINLFFQNIKHINLNKK